MLEELLSIKDGLLGELRACSGQHLSTSFPRPSGPVPVLAGGDSTCLLWGCSSGATASASANPRSLLPAPGLPSPGMGDRVRRQAAPPGCSRDGDDGEGWQQG